MTTYSDIDDIKALIGFTLDENSRPTLLNAAKIQGQAYRLINGYIGKARTPDDNLKAVETDLVVAAILAIHNKKAYPMRLTEEHMVILDDYMDEEELVSSEDIYYGYD